MYQSPQSYIAPQANPMQQGAGAFNSGTPVNYATPLQQGLPQQQFNGNWKTTVTYAPPQAGMPPAIIQTQEMPIRQLQPSGSGQTGFAGGQQP